LIRLLIVDDDPLVREHLQIILETAEDITVVGAADEGAEAVEDAIRLKPDVILMDVRMPGLNGVEATKRIVSTNPAAIVVMLTTFDTDELVAQALRAGAAGFLLKSTPPRDLVNLVRVARDGHIVLSPIAMAGLVARTAAASNERLHAQDRLTKLSPRETDVMRHLAEGAQTKEIAAAMNVTPATIKGYISHILTKLELDNRTQAAVLAQQAQLSDAPTGQSAPRIRPRPRPNGRDHRR
jgi:DNA-binding NarL/FixJ family response regulator